MGARSERLLIVLFVVLSVFGCDEAYSSWSAHYHVVYCTLSAHLSGVRLRVDQPKRLIPSYDNFTECGRFVSPERINFNFAGRLLVLRRRSESSYFDMCTNDETLVLTAASKEPTIVVVNSSTPSCDINARYRAALNLRDSKLPELKGLFLIGGKFSSESNGNDMIELLTNAEFPVLLSDSLTPGLMSLLLNAEENAQAYYRNRSQPGEPDESQYGIEMAIKVVYGKAVPATVYLGAPLTISKTSVLFVAISFMTLMLVSLAWLLVYYVQRFRYVHAKDRIARQLDKAARKALARIATRTLKTGDAELASDETVCAICIEPYAVEQVVRVLPCRHTFHRSCVDAWLLEQRSCPVCKLDILKAFGLSLVQQSESTRRHSDHDHRSDRLLSSSVSSSSRRTREQPNASANANVHIVLTHADIAPRRFDDHSQDATIETEAETNVTVTTTTNRAASQSDVDGCTNANPCNHEAASDSAEPTENNALIGS